MTKPCIITVAITGSLPTKTDNPAVPITIAEQVESTQAAFEAGATLAHCHVRNDDGTPTASPERFGRLLEGLKKHCPGMIVQLSTPASGLPEGVCSKPFDNIKYATAGKAPPFSAVRPTSSVTSCIMSHPGSQSSFRPNPRGYSSITIRLLVSKEPRTRHPMSTFAIICSWVETRLAVVS